MRERKSGSVRPQHQDIDDDATVGSTTAVLQGTHNNDEAEVEGESSTLSFERILAAQSKISNHRRKTRFTPPVIPVAAVSTATILEEGSGDDEEESQPSRAKMFDLAAMRQGTRNGNDGKAKGKEGGSSATSFEQILSARSKISNQRRKTRFAPPAIPVGAESPVVEKGNDDSLPIRARVFDVRRISIILALLVIIISVAVGISLGFAKPPPSFSTSTATPPHPNPNEDGLPHLHKYAYVFVVYDRRGYAVAQSLYDQLEKSVEKQGSRKQMGGLKKHSIDARREFNAETLCTELNLESNTFTILKSPEFHCTMPKLRSLFMDHKDHTKEKWGVKLIHLVRSPFSMSVANYLDHKSMHEHGKEVWHVNPCSRVTENFTMTVADLNSPILSENGIMTYDDFDNILARCNTMFRTQPGLENASYQQHLEELPPVDGLQLAVSDVLNDIALMASDLITFKQVHAMVKEQNLNPERKKKRHLDMMTVPMDEVLTYPGKTMMDFLDFMFGTAMSSISKHKAAAEYEHHKKNVASSVNATEMEELIGFLKTDPLFGGPLSRVESLMNSVLFEKEGEVER
mmetsp:Transcript_18435/g.38587  ORF Transcript_18435/g.38587 Transcript_18435/m.38587 type:complete len:573 (+) Transcript_18435:93-1811(+)